MCCAIISSSSVGTTYTGIRLSDRDISRACREFSAGSRLRGRVTVAEAEDVPPDGLRVNYHLVIEIEGGKRPACVAELIALHYR